MMGCLFDRDEAIKNLTAQGVTVNPHSLDYGFITWVTEEVGPFSSVEEAMRNPVFSEKIRASLTEASLMAENVLPKDLAHDVKNTILEYPKIVVSTAAGDISKEKLDDFIALGSIRLPFPRITFIDVATDFATAGGFTHTFLRQTDDSVSVLTFLSNMKEYTNRIEISDNNYHGFQPLVFHLYIENHTVRVSLGSTVRKNACLPRVGLIDRLVNNALYCIHKTTISDGDGDYYVSKPTPREIQVNRKKLSKRKKPTIEFRLIKLDGYKPQLPSLPQGTHASPRQHWRRGHWRNLASGKRVFIKPMLVGDEKNGKIIKDYIVEEPAHAH